MSYSRGTINIPNVTGNIVITAVATPAVVTSIDAVYRQTGTVYDTDSLDVLRTDLTVVANYADASSGTVSAYTLSGTLTAGTSTITVSYAGQTDTFNVTVTEYPSYSITYNLTNVTSSNNAVKVAQGGSYTTTLSYDDELYMLNTLTVTMGGTDITSSVYGDGVVQINEVTGNVVITATASQIVLNDVVMKKAGASLQYIDAQGELITYKPYSSYGMVLDVASANSTATVTITNNGESAVGANFAIYAGETDRYLDTGTVKMYNASVAFTVPSLGIASGGSVTFTATVHKGYRLMFTVPSENCSVVVKGIANDEITYTKTYTTAISNAGQPSYYYDGADTSSTQNTVNYAKNRITTETFSQDTVVTIILEQKEDVSTGDVNANRWFACATSATGGSEFFYATKLATEGALPNQVYARFVYTVKAGYYLAIQSAAATSLSETYSVKVVQGDVR